jgi:transcription elongation factor Elf1
MKLVAFTCPACGAQLSVDIENRKASCQYCGAAFPIDDEARHIQYDNAEQAGYEFEKGRQRAKAEIEPQVHQVFVAYDDTGDYAVQPQKKRKTWLWVLGWIFIFPVPATILIQRSNMNIVTRVFLIILVWVLYLAIAGSGGKN